MAETERIPQHKHCGTCGNAYVKEGRFCSDACMEKKRSELKKKKRQLLIVEVVAMAMLIFAVVFGMMR